MLSQIYKLHVGQLLLSSFANGPGRRAVVWVQGCRILCPGCINSSLLSQQRRFLVDPKALCHKIFEQNEALEGVTLSGGEPFDQPKACSDFLATAKSLGLSTMVFSGYTLEALRSQADPRIDHMLTLIDLLIDGPFLRKEAADLLWRGSRNQRILFLTARYTPKILEEEGPHEEWVLNGGSTITRTGIAQPSLFHPVR